MSKAFVKWMAVVVTLYGVTAIGLHVLFSRQPQRILVGVDASFGMRAKWSAVKDTLKEINKEGRYTEYALVTDKNQVHSWSNSLSLGTTLTYGPRRMNTFYNGKYDGLANEADEMLLITSDPGTHDQAIAAGWEIIRP